MAEVSIQKTEAYMRSVKKITEPAKGYITEAIEDLADGKSGKRKGVGKVSELKIHYGPGYRVYYVWRGDTLILLLCGDKSSQKRDIVRARKLAEEL